MNIKRFIAASIVVFVANQITDPIIHGLILGKTYETLQHLWRVDMMSKMWVMILASFIWQNANFLRQSVPVLATLPIHG